MKQGAKCPACGETFSKLKNYGCPYCKVKLTLAQTKEGQKNVNKYVLTNPPKQETNPPEAYHFIFGQVNSVREDDRKWSVYVGLLLQTLHCPECGRAAIWYPDIKQGSLSHKCERCKAITEYHFKL